MPFATETDYRITPSTPIVMTTLRGAGIELSADGVRIAPDRVELVGSVTFADWMRALDHGAFHVDLELGDLDDDPQRRVDLRLVLRVAFAYDFDDPDAFVGELVDAAPSVLHQTDAWMLAEALQTIALADGDGATASTGFRTSWALPVG